MIIAQLEVVLQDLVAKGGGWGIAAALLWIGWRIWKEVKPSLSAWLELRTKEIAIHERNAKAREDGVEVAREHNKSIEGLTTSLNSLRDGLSGAMNNGFKRMTDKIVGPKNDKNNGGS